MFLTLCRHVRFVTSRFYNNGDEAYGAAIREEIEAATGRKCSIGALYTTVERLETKGLKTWMGDATPQRGGRAKRMIRVTGKGAAARSFYEEVTRMSRGIAWETNRAGSSGTWWLRRGDRNGESLTYP